jgi:hypothetical protein
MSAPAVTDATPFEAGVLGAVIRDQGPAALLALLPAAADFQLGRHTSVATVLHALSDAGRPIDHNTVAADLAQTDSRVDREQSDAIVAELVRQSTDTSSFRDYARRVTVAAVERRAISAAYKLPERIANGENVAQVASSTGEELHLLAGAAGATESSWRPIDIGETLDRIARGEDITPTPTIGRRTDGQACLYPGEVVSLAGEPGVGKGHTTNAIIVQVLDDGGRALMLDFEDGIASILARLLAQGADPDALRERFTYVRPTDAFNPDALTRLLDAHTYELAVLDGMTEAYALLGLDSLVNQDAAKFIGMLPRRIADTGAAVLLIDHVSKNKEGRGRYVLGAGHKVAGIAATYTVEVATPYSRTTPGKLKVICQKDRHGTYAIGETVTLVTVHPHGDRLTITLDPPDPTGDDGTIRRPTFLMERVSRLVERDCGLSASDIKDAGLGKRAEYVVKALGVLVDEGYIAVESGPRGRKNHRSVRPYREADDTPQPFRVPEPFRTIPGTGPDDPFPVPPPLRGNGTGTGADNGHKRPTHSHQQEQRQEGQR